MKHHYYSDFIYQHHHFNTWRYQLDFRGVVPSSAKFISTVLPTPARSHLRSQDMNTTSSLQWTVKVETSSTCGTVKGVRILLINKQSSSPSTLVPARDNISREWLNILATSGLRNYQNLLGCTSTSPTTQLVTSSIAYWKKSDPKINSFWEVEKATT